jgi:hypothetical protein
MKKIILLLICVIISLFVHSQTWDDDLGLIDSLHIGTWVANVNDLFNDGDSVLYIAGPFSYVNLQNTYQVVKWNGYNYYLLQNGIASGGINVVTRFKNQILFGGDFTHVNNIPNTARLVAWNSTNWQSVGGGGLTGEVRDFIVSNDTLYISGDFEHIGTEEYNKVAAFSNNTWINMGYWGQWVSALEIMNGELYGGGYHGFRRYLGNQEWEIFPEQPSGNVYELKTDSVNSFLYVCGGFYQVGDSVSSGVAIWDGFKWNYTGYYCRTVPWPQSVAIYRGDLFTGCGRYYDNETEYRTYITRWNGESWDSIGGAFNDNIFALEVFRDTLYIGGGFTHWGGDSPNPTNRSKGLVKLYMPDNGCDYLKPRINTWADTFYLNNGEAVVNLYNNNPYVDSWEWDFGTSTGSVSLSQAVEHIYTATGEYNVQVTVTDGECVKTANKTIYIELGTEVIDIESIDMQIFPNPSNNDFYVKLTLPNYQNTEIKIAGLNGHLQSIIPITNETTTIPTKGWKPGVYICNLFVDGELIKVEKLVYE